MKATSGILNFGNYSAHNPKFDPVPRRCRWWNKWARWRAMNFQRSRRRVIWRFQQNNSHRMLRADSFARCGLHERGEQNESGPTSVGITGRPTTGCSICRTDASSWSHISRLMVITIYHPGVTFSGVRMHVQQHGRLFVKDRVYLYTIAHTTP